MPPVVNLSMAERLSANMKITAQCKRTFPDLEKSALSKRASSFETEIYQNCTSSDDYQERCQAVLNDLAAQVEHVEPLETTGDSYMPDMDRPVERIGPYAATYHASGLFSTIYRSASDSRPNEVIAIKLATPSAMVAPHNAHREARILRLISHESVIAIYSSQAISGGHYIITFPFLPYDLATLLDRGSLTKPQIKSHLYTLFDALAHCHSLGVLHRDIKPSNILLTSASGPAYLADFGIAWIDSDPDSEPADEKITDIGTTCYRAPELLFGNPRYGEGVDLWAAGCVIAEAENQGTALFDSGDVGSELALIRSIFSTLGTPNDTTWPEAKTFPDWGKMAFREYPSREWHDVIPKAGENGRDLVARLITYESSQRLSASDVLKHPYFDGIQTKA